ncbi:MAG: AfsR/SARP family transcriptional regulator [Stenotrophomonas sp.]|uniref:AfsR/SARP family transcriptional regulator n=1 Tax=Stenotrophomonas sp. TaxID=69392 RepID=UPI003D6C87CB
MAHLAELEAVRAEDARCGVVEQERGHELVRLLGDANGLPVPLIYRKAWGLLGFLAVESDRRHSRSMLAGLFWPGLGETSALTNLRQVLSNLNRYCMKALGPDVLRIERGAVGLMRGERLLFDIDLLWRAPCRAMELLTEQQRFLEGLDDLGGADFHGWLETTRQNLDIQLVGAAQRCCDELLEAQDWEQAVEVARTLTLRDPWNEAHARRMMRAHAGGGKRAAALNVYQRFETMLRVELGLEPGQETLQLLAQINAASLSPSSAHN